MPGLDYRASESNEPGPKECEVATSRNARVGLIFFTIYLLIYCAYVGVAAFARALMQATPVAGLNVATLYGLGLIALALVFAVAYGWVCRAPSSSMSSPGKLGDAPCDISPSSRSGRDA